MMRTAKMKVTQVWTSPAGREDAYEALTTTHQPRRGTMAGDSLPHRVSRAPRSRKHSLKEPLMGKSATAARSHIIRLRASGRGTPNTVNGKVPPRRIPNQERRSREYLTDKEVAALMDAARKTGRHGHRDAALILLAYRHAFRRLALGPDRSRSRVVACHTCQERNALNTSLTRT